MSASSRVVSTSKAVTGISHIKAFRSLVQGNQASALRGASDFSSGTELSGPRTYDADNLLPSSIQSPNFSPGLTPAQQHSFALSLGLTTHSTNTDLSKAISALLEPAQTSSVLVDMLLEDNNLTQLATVNSQIPTESAPVETVAANHTKDTESAAVIPSLSYTSWSTADLLAKLIGSHESRLLYHGSLRPLFSKSQDTGQPHEKLIIAKELVKRLLLEELQQGVELSSSSSVRDYLRLLMSGHEHEEFVVIFLDTQHRVIAVEEMFRGTLTQTFVHPREVVKVALRHNAASAIFAHNHPSGRALPSKADRLLTKALKQALALVDVSVLDHFIVTSGNKISSMAESGIL